MKALNTIYYQHLVNRGRTDLPLEERHPVFVAGEDPGSLGREELWMEIREQASRQGVSVPEVGDSVLDKLSTREQARRQGIAVPEVGVAGTRC